MLQSTTMENNDYVDSAVINDVKQGGDGSRNNDDSCN